MTIKVEIHSDLLSENPLESSYLHLTIICSALKYCLGRSKTMSFIKLAYIFDKTMALESGAFDSKLTLSPWRISLTYKKSLILSEAHDLVELNSKDAKEVRISITDKGLDFVNGVEGLEVFNKYLDYLRDINIAENRFNSMMIRSMPNVY